jgi:hypothetical protein
VEAQGATGKDNKGPLDKEEKGLQEKKKKGPEKQNKGPKVSDLLAPMITFIDRMLNSTSAES